MISALLKISLFIGVVILLGITYKIGFYNGARRGITATVSFFESEINTMKKTGRPAFKLVSETKDTVTYYISKDDIVKTIDE